LSIYPGGVDRLSAAFMGSCAYCERLSILGEFELLHALASVVLSLCLFLEEPVLCHCMTVLSPASFLRGHSLLIGCVEPLPMSLGTDFWLWFVSLRVILLNFSLAFDHLDAIFGFCTSNHLFVLDSCQVTHQGGEMFQTMSINTLVYLVMSD